MHAVEPLGDCIDTGRQTVERFEADFGGQHAASITVQPAAHSEDKPANAVSQAVQLLDNLHVAHTGQVARSCLGQDLGRPSGVLCYGGDLMQLVRELVGTV